MASSALIREERIGLAVAIAAHAVLLGVLLLGPSSGGVVTPPERIEVSLSEQVGLTSTSPDPYTDAAPVVAPQIGEPLPPLIDVPEPEPEQAPETPVAQPDRPQPTPQSRSSPAPPQQASRPRPAPEAAPARPQTARPQPTPRPSPAPERSERSGGSRIGSDFLEGIGGSEGSSRSASAAEIGPREQASLASSISRQLKPHWVAPQGADAEQLVTIVRFRLNRDGGLAGTPSIVRQSGITPANEAQKGRHAEQALRAIRLAAPFNLPQEFYEGWKTVNSQFDRRLSE